MIKYFHFPLLVLLTLTIPVTAQEEGPLRGPYLAQSTPSSIVIVWRTANKTEPVVRFGISPKDLQSQVTAQAIKNRTKGTEAESLSDAPVGSVQFEAQLTDLKPETKYYYAVYDGEKLLAGGSDYHFTTHPLPNTKKPFRFWVVGDSGTGGTDQTRVNDAMLALTAKQKRPLDFYLHVGDMAYHTGTDKQFQKNFFKPYEETLRQVVCWPSMGNHEGTSSDGKTATGPYYDAYVTPTRGEAGGLASGTEAYYSFDYANVHFICLNSHDLDRSTTGAMAQWLKADLEMTRADWIVAFFHHPPYTKGSHDSDKETQLIEIRANIMPILESAGVDLVLTGHSHIYERSMLIDGAYDTPTVAENFVLDAGDGNPEGDGAYRKSSGLHPHEGTVQVVTGNGGTKLTRNGTMPVMKRILMEHGSVIVDVDNDTLTAIMLNADGEERDLFSIIKRGQVKLERVTQIKPLPPFISVNRLANLKMEPLSLSKSGATTSGVVTFGRIPKDLVVENARARIVWDTADTSWKVSPPEVVVSLKAGETPPPQKFSFSTASDKNVYPLPSARIVYNINPLEDNGKEMMNDTVTLKVKIAPYKRAPLARMKTDPTIDGVLNKNELAGLTPQTDLIESEGTGLAEQPTEFYVGLRNNQLYLAVISHEPAMDKMLNVEREHDGELWKDEGVEILLQREGAPDFYHFIVNAAGQRYDSKTSKLEWNGEWSTAVKLEKDRWVSETLIPLDILGPPLKAGEVLRFNLVRNNQIRQEFSQWSHTNRDGNLKPNYYGSLVVEEE